MRRCVPLEREALKVANDNSICPLIFQLPPEEGRKRLNEAQDTPIATYPVEKLCTEVSTGTWGTLKVYFTMPAKKEGPLNVLYYIHGAGWVFGNYHTHYKLVCELANRTNSIVVFPEYSLSPEAKYPTAIEQCYFILCSLNKLLKGLSCSIQMDHLIVAGDSVGGNMATVMTLLAKCRKGPSIKGQVLYYPVTNACFDTCTYHEFAEDYYLYRKGMIWFWNQYTSCEKERREITASPLLASCEQLSGLPPAIILNGEADVLRAEGEAYARKLRESGVSVTAVRFQAMIHDFVMLNALDQTEACRAAMDSSTAWIQRILTDTSYN